MQGPEGPGRSGPKAPVSKLSWRCCSLLSHLGGGPYADLFSVVALLTIISSLLIASGARQAPRPKAAGSRHPTGQRAAAETFFQLSQLDMGRKQRGSSYLVLYAKAQRARELRTKSPVSNFTAFYRPL